MALSGQAKTDYQRMYVQLRRNGSAKAAKPVTCSFCGEAGTADRLLVGDRTAAICEECITLAVARIADARRDADTGPARQWARGFGPAPWFTSGLNRLASEC